MRKITQCGVKLRWKKFLEKGKNFPICWAAINIFPLPHQIFSALITSISESIQKNIIKKVLSSIFSFFSQRGEKISFVHKRFFVFGFILLLCALSIFFFDFPFFQSFPKLPEKCSTKNWQIYLHINWFIRNNFPQHLRRMWRNANHDVPISVTFSRGRCEGFEGLWCRDAEPVNKERNWKKFSL